MMALQLVMGTKAILLCSVSPRFGRCLLPLILTLACNSPALSAESASYQFEPTVIDTGGRISSSASYTFTSAIGQPSAIGIVSSPSYTFSQGFIAAVGAQFASDVKFSAGLGGAADGRGVAWGDFDDNGESDIYIGLGTGELAAGISSYVR